MKKIILDIPLNLTNENSTKLIYQYQEIADLIDKISLIFIGLSITKNSYVVIYKSSNFDISLYALACMRIGAIPVLFASDLETNVSEDLIHNFHECFILTDNLALTEKINTSNTQYKIIDPKFLIDNNKRFLTDNILEKNLMIKAKKPNEICMITHSSGTTGTPKLAVHTYKSLSARTMIQRVLSLTMWREKQAVLSMSHAHSRYYSSLAVCAFLNLDIGILCNNTDISTIRNYFSHLRPNIIETPPNNYIFWSKIFADNESPFTYVKFFHSTFDALHPATVKSILQQSRRQNPKFIQLYGQSETGPVAIAAYSLKKKIDTRRVGYSLPFYSRIRIVDDFGKKVKKNTNGNIETKTRGRIVDYFGNNQQYNNSLKNKNWWNMGDIGVINKKNRALYLLDRKFDTTEDMSFSNLVYEDMILNQVSDLTEVIIVSTENGKFIPIITTQSDRLLNRSDWVNATAEMHELAEPLHWKESLLPKTSTLKVKRGLIKKILNQENLKDYLVTSYNHTNP